MLTTAILQRNTSIIYCIDSGVDNKSIIVQYNKQQCSNSDDDNSNITVQYN